MAGLGLRRRICIAWRILAALALALPLIPIQLIALKRDWPLRRRLPVLFHRALLAILDVRVERRGAPDAMRPLLVVSNHVSWLDIPVIGAAAPISFIAKSEVASWPVIGLFARLQHSVFIERGRRHKTGEAADRIGARLSQGDVMVLFGEGTTGDGTRVLPFRSALVGAAHRAAADDTAAGAVLVQPLCIRYARRNGLPLTRATLPGIAWTGDMDLAPHLFDVLAGGPIDVVLSWGEPIAVDPSGDRKALTRRIESAVRAMSHR
jgi:1-acyl-sn-glycerol-3-phosphate acyltransferase